MWPFGDPAIAGRAFARLVVRVPNWLGDQIMAVPALRALRARYPDAYIAGHGGEMARQLYEGAPFLDDFLVSGKRAGAWGQARLLRAGRFDACVLLTGSFRTALPPLLAGIPHRIGFRRSGRTLLLTAHWPRPRPGGRKAPYPTKRYFLDLVGRLGAHDAGRAELFVPPSAEPALASWMAGHGLRASDSLLGLCVGASFGPSKIWPASHFAAVADHMTERHGARAVLLCGPGEEAIGAAVRARARLPVIDTGTRPLGIDLLKALLARVRVLLTNDTGPRHIAAAFRVPIVCLIGPTDPTYTESDAEGQVILREAVDCAPCHLKVCPIDHRCMTRITPERAIEAVERLWSGPAAGADKIPGLHTEE